MGGAVFSVVKALIPSLKSIGRVMPSQFRAVRVSQDLRLRSRQKEDPDEEKVPAGHRWSRWVAFGMLTKPSQAKQTEREKENFMTPQEHITKMTTAIRQAIKVMGDRFGSTEQDVAKAIQDLKASMQGGTESRVDSSTTKQPVSVNSELAITPQ